jgi:1,4-dihydroxy-2-naphthoate octaprenyltransferase
MFVFLFFGLAAVIGSYYIQTLAWSLNALAAAFAIGMLAAAILLVNNYRDLETDRQARKLTLVHRLGEGWSRHLYGILLIVPFLLPVFLEVKGQGYWVVLGVLPFAVVMVRRFSRETRGPGFNRILAATARLQFAFGVVLSLALVI